VSQRLLYLLDTTVLIDVSRRREPASTWLEETLLRQVQVGVSAVTVAEFFAGLRPVLRAEWRDFLEGLSHWDVTRDIAIRAGILRYDLARRGRTMQGPDALIAATAIALGAALVTANVKDFLAPELEVIRLGP
jgi:predicted nucleic acid-binding protein